MKKSKLELVEIEGLFGRFNYSIDLTRHEDGISIITAPNGYGKSTILNLIEIFSSGSHFRYISENFRRIKFHISGREPVEVIRVADGEERGQVTIRAGRQSTKVKDPFEIHDRSFMVERVIPFLTRVSPTHWKNDRTGELLSKSEILARYGGHPFFRRQFKREDWLEEIRTSLEVFNIPTNRLKTDWDQEDRRSGASGRSLMVSAISEEIKDRIQTAIRHQFEVGRKKETSFPARLIDSLRGGEIPQKESIAESIKAVQEYEAKYSRLGLVPHTGTTEQLSYQTTSQEAAALVVLKTFLDDVREKFALLETLAEKLDVFCRSINSLIAFKSIETSADVGLIARLSDGDKEQIPLSVLSSGEQHLLVLIGKLVFNTEEGTLVLIDEPEISFHPEWQEKFMAILEDIRQVNGFSVLIATHSPTLIGSRWNSVIELAEQYVAD